MAGWLNLSKYIGDIGLLGGAPTRDASGQWVSGASDDTGTTMTVTGLVSAGTTTPNYAGFYVGSLATLFPALPMDGTAAIEIRATTISDATANANYIQGVGLGNDATLVANGFMTPAYYAGTGASGRETAIVYVTTLFRSTFSLATPRRWILPISANGLQASALAAGSAGTSSAVPGASNTTGLAIFAGTRTAPGAQQSAKILWEVRAVSWTLDYVAVREKYQGQLIARQPSLQNTALLQGQGIWFQG